jgi:hypothetical protein
MKRLTTTVVAAAAFVIFVVSPAHAIKALIATVALGKVQVSGIQATKNASILWEGSVVTTSNKLGIFAFSTTNLPIDCVGQLSDGMSTIDVVIHGCTTVQGGGGEVAATGQTVCYDSVGAVIPCAGTGQDGEYQAGTPLPSPRFTVNGDGTVTDILTGLIWLQDANCFLTRTWAQALADANGLASGSCGLTDGSVAGDWRLPNVRELQSLIHYGFFNPALSNATGTAKWMTNGDAFNNVVASDYWSSTTVEDDPSFAWVVNFGVGFVIVNGKGHQLCSSRSRSVIDYLEI